MWVIALILALSAFVGLFVNAGRKLFLWLRPLFTGVSPVVYGTVYGVILTAVLAFFVVSRIPDNGLPRIIFNIAHYALGFLLYIMMLANLVDLLLFLGRILRLLPAQLPQQASIAAGTVVLVIAAGLSVYGAVHASAIQTSRYEVQLRLGTEAEERASLQIALISDLHLGYVMEENHMKKIVAAVNAVKPDLICIAGDIFDGDATSLKNPEALQHLFREMKATHGVYAVHGNHDAGASYDQMMDFLAGAGVQVLKDEAVAIDGRVVLAGRMDSSPIGRQGEGRKALELPQGTEELPVIVMDHQPGNIKEYGGNVDLIFCGHTHQGQMFPFNLITNALFDVDYGYYQMPDNGPQVIVTSGAGTWGPPQRVATDNEIAAVRIEFPSR